MINTLLEFLKNKQGYLKKSPEQLFLRFNRMGIDANYEDCKLALAEAKLIAKEKEFDNLISPGQKVLIWDIETSYNIAKVWRTGYNLTIHPTAIIHERKIICISYKWVGEDTIYNITWDKNQCDKFMIEQFVEVMNESDLMVAHNGDRFDMKWVKTRAIFHGIPMLLNYKSLDTLKLAKKKFNFNSNKLDYIAEFLGFGNKISTNLQLWDDIILRKDPVAMKEMVRYCNMDVELLEKVYLKLVVWDAPKNHVGVLNGGETYSSPISGSLDLEMIKKLVTPAGTLKYVMKDLSTDGVFEMTAPNYKKWLTNK